MLRRETIFFVAIIFNRIRRVYFIYAFSFNTNNLVLYTIFIQWPNNWNAENNFDHQKTFVLVWNMKLIEKMRNLMILVLLTCWSENKTYLTSTNTQMRRQCPSTAFWKFRKFARIFLFVWHHRLRLCTFMHGIICLPPQIDPSIKKYTSGR